MKSSVAYAIGAAGFAIGAVAELYDGDSRQAVGFALVSFLIAAVAIGHKTGRLPLVRNRRREEK
jgi:hypothetical protein